MPPTPSSHSKLRILPLIGCVLGVFVLHVVFTFLAYPKGDPMTNPLWRSVAVSVGLPFAAFTAYACALFWSGFCAGESFWFRTVVVIIISFVIAFFSLWGSMIVPINLYGT